MKRCAKCGTEKTRREFAKNSKSNDGLSSWCAECHREHARAAYHTNRPAVIERALQWNRANPERHKRNWWNSYYRRTYGITHAEYDAIHDAQQGRCAICDEVPTGNRLAVDHDHDTGRVRGLLCVACNTAIGRFGDTAHGLRRALAYLEGGVDALQAVR